MPYIDYHGFGEDYFKTDGVANPHPAGYSNYRRGLLPFDYYASVVGNSLAGLGIPPAGQKALVVGCACGYTVERLIDDWGVNAYGMDVSQWAVSRAAEETAYGGRIYQGDVRNAQDLRTVRQATPGGPFAVVYNECVLECLADEEAQTAAQNMRDNAQKIVLNRVWSSDGSDVNSDYYNSKTLAEWQSLCDPAGVDRWYTEDEFQPDL